MLISLSKLNLRSVALHNLGFSAKTSSIMCLASKTNTLHGCKMQEKVEKRSLKFQSHPLQHPYKPRLSDTLLPSPMWRLFYRQNIAFEYAATRKNAKIFSVESVDEPKCGPRSYIVASLEEFWAYYKQIPTGKRHFYELIPLDSHCHMYFDLEFNKSDNEYADGNSMVDLWISFVSFCLKSEFNIVVNRSHVIELDSTTEKKFSQHLIWHLPNATFKNNIEVGNFVHYICDSLRSYETLKKDNSPLFSHWIHSSDNVEKLDLLFINSSSSEKTLFVDESVYTKNRNFRLYLSSKKGKTTELTLSPHCDFPFSPVNLLSTCCCHHALTLKVDDRCCRYKEKLIFFSSLVTNIHTHDDIKLLEMPAEKCRDKRSNILMHKSSVMKNGSKINPSDFPTDGCVSPECFSILHEFVTKYVQEFNENAYVSKVSLIRDNDQNFGTLFFDVVGTRYCPTVGREHKSNGIFIVINLDKKLCYHKCYDYECRNSSVKPNPIPLPALLSDYLPEIAPDFAKEYELSDLELLHQVEQIEKDTNYEH